MGIEQFVWLDWLIVGLLLFSVVIGAFRGFIHGIVLLVSWIGGALLGVHYAASFGPKLHFLSSSSNLQSVAAFIIILLVSVIAGHIISRVLSTILSKIGLGGLNLFLGVVFGFVRGVLSIGVLLLVLGTTSMTDTHSWKKSVMRPMWNPVVTAFQQWLNMNMKPAAEVLKQKEPTSKSSTDKEKKGVSTATAATAT